MKTPHSQALETHKGFPILNELPKDYTGTHRTITKGKHKGKHLLFDLTKQK